MTDQERQTFALEKAVSDAVSKALDPMVDDIHKIRRAVNGALDEGNEGILTRMARTERRVAVLIWLMPLWITGGTAIGQYLVKLWGI